MGDTISLNFAGLGFSFAAQDKGLSKYVQQLTTGFTGLQSTINDVMLAADTLSGSGLNLSTTFEDMVVQASTTSRRVGASYGVLGDKLHKFTRNATGLSIALNIGADAAAGAEHAFESLAEVDGAFPKALGFKSAKDVAKFTTVTGVSAETLRHSLLTLSRDLQFSGKESGALFDTLIKSGELMADIPGQIESFPEILDKIRQRAQSFGRELSTGELVAYGQEIARTSAMATQLFADPKQAREFAHAFTGATLGGVEQMNKLFAGLENDLPNIVRELAITTGDVQEVFEMMGQGPEAFMNTLSRMVQSAQKSGQMDRLTQFMRERLGAAFGMEGVDGAKLTRFLEQFNGDKFNSQWKEAKGSVEAVNKAFRTGRTLTEQLEIITEGWLARIRGVDNSGERLVRDLRKQTKLWGDEALRLVKDKDSVMGRWISKLAEVSKLGVLALAPEPWRAQAVMIGRATAKLEPFIRGMGSMLGIMHDSVMTLTQVATNPFVLAGVAMGSAVAVYETQLFKFKGNTEAALGETVKIIDTFVNDAVSGLEGLLKGSGFSSDGILGKYIDLFRRLYSDIDWSGYWERTWSAMKPAIWSMLEKMGDLLSKGVDMLGDKVLFKINQMATEDPMKFIVLSAALGGPKAAALATAFAASAQAVDAFGNPGHTSSDLDKLRGSADESSRAIRNRIVAQEAERQGIDFSQAMMEESLYNALLRADRMRGRKPEGPERDRKLDIRVRPTDAGWEASYSVAGAPGR